MPNTINGAPVHPLLVHAVVVLVPLAALLTLAGSVFPSVRQKFGIVIPGVAFVAMGFVPLTTQAGEWLQAHVPDTALVRQHVRMGDGLTIFAGLVFVVAFVRWYLDIAPEKGWPVPGLARKAFVAPAIIGVSALVALAVLVQTYRIGDSGAKAAWANQLVPAHAVQGGG